MRKINFECTVCSWKVIEEITEYAVVCTPIEKLIISDVDGDFSTYESIYDAPEILDGEIARYQCEGCGQDYTLEQLYTTFGIQEE